MLPEPCICNLVMMKISNGRFLKEHCIRDAALWELRQFLQRKLCYLWPNKWKCQLILTSICSNSHNVLGSNPGRGTLPWELCFIFIFYFYYVGSSWNDNLGWGSVQHRNAMYSSGQVSLKLEHITSPRTQLCNLWPNKLNYSSTDLNWNMLKHASWSWQKSWKSYITKGIILCFFPFNIEKQCKVVIKVVWN